MITLTEYQDKNLSAAVTYADDSVVVHENLSVSGIRRGALRNPADKGRAVRVHFSSPVTATQKTFINDWLRFSLHPWSNLGNVTYEH